MTELVVARRDGILTAPDGTKYRLARGKTLADARHPAVAASPQSFAPMKIELSVEDDEPSPAAASDASEELAEVESERDAYREQLVVIAAGLADRGVTLPLEDERSPGWLADAVFAALDAQPSRGDRGETPVAPEQPAAGATARKPRKRLTPPVAGDGNGE